MWDGVSNNWQQQGEPRQDFPQEGIAEFKVQAFNASADFGFAQGGYLNVVTKSGTNDLSGSAFEFFRTKALNSKTVLQDEKPDYSRHQFGGSLGGPHRPGQVPLLRLGGVHGRVFLLHREHRRAPIPRKKGPSSGPTGTSWRSRRYDHAINEEHRLFLRYAHQNNELTPPGFRRNQRGEPRLRLRSAPALVRAGRDLVPESPTPSTTSGSSWRRRPTSAGPRGRRSGATRANSPAERVDVGPLINRPSLRTGNQSAFLGPEAPLPGQERPDPLPGPARAEGRRQPHLDRLGAGQCGDRRAVVVLERRALRSERSLDPIPIASRSGCCRVSTTSRTPSNRCTSTTPGQ